MLHLAAISKCAVLQALLCRLCIKFVVLPRVLCAIIISAVEHSLIERYGIYFIKRLTRSGTVVLLSYKLYTEDLLSQQLFCVCTIYIF
jgi:hypothetical protein